MYQLLYASRLYIIYYTLCTHSIVHIGMGMGKIIIIMFLKTNITVQNEVVERNKTLFIFYGGFFGIFSFKDEARLHV